MCLCSKYRRRGHTFLLFRIGPNHQFCLPSIIKKPSLHHFFFLLIVEISAWSTVGQYRLCCLLCLSSQGCASVWSLTAFGLILWTLVPMAQGHQPGLVFHVLLCSAVLHCCILRQLGRAKALGNPFASPAEAQEGLC